MGKLFVLMGKSASGKDTIYEQLLKRDRLGLRAVVPYTTRPIRSGEVPGETYHFCSAEEAKAMGQAGRIIELRTYQTIHGPWSYFTADDGQIDLSRHSYLVIGTLESFRQFQDYFSSDAVVPLYIFAEDGMRLQRALDRERRQSEPKYEELCRRFLADQTDFSEEKLEEAGIRRKFENLELEHTAALLQEYIRNVLAETEES
jgi:guanylate kinase